MNSTALFPALSLVCAALALGLFAKDRARTHRARSPKKLAANVKSMLRRRLAFLPLASILVLSSASRPAYAQEVIHARAGQVVAVNSRSKTLTLKVADGSTVLFHDVADPAPAMAFDKELRDKTVGAAAFHDVGAYAVVFYFGFDEPTAVALEPLGATVPQRMIGSVASFDHRQHLLTLKTDSAQAQKVVVPDDTAVETSEGVVKMANFHPSRGQQLRCVAKPDSQAAVFVALN